MDAITDAITYFTTHLNGTAPAPVQAELEKAGLVYMDVPGGRLAVFPSPIQVGLMYGVLDAFGLEARRGPEERDE